MSEDNAEVYKTTLNDVFKDPFLWAVALIVFENEKKKMSYWDIKMELVVKNIVKYDDEIRPKLCKVRDELKANGLLEKDAEYDAVELNSAGINVVDKVKQMISILIMARKAKDSIAHKDSAAC